MSDMTPGWQADPTGRHSHRYWDGSRWTDDVADAGVAAKDPYDGPATPPAGDAAPGEPAADPGATDPAPTIAGPLPTQDPTATWQTAAGPPPPSGPSAGGPPPPAVPAAAAAASGGSKKGFLIGLGVLLAVALGVGAFIMFSGDDDDDDRERIHGELVAIINEDGTLTEKQADCTADHIIDELGVDRLRDVDFSADEPPADLEDDFFEAAMGAMGKCGFSLEDVMGSDSDDGAIDDEVDDDVDFGDDTDDFDFGDDIDGDVFGPEFEEMLAGIYADTFDLSQDKAECLAGKIADAMSSGALTEDEMMTDIFSYFSDCDISMSELGGN